MRLGRRLATGVAEHPTVPAPAEPVETTEPRAERPEPVRETPQPAELAER